MVYREEAEGKIAYTIDFSGRKSPSVSGWYIEVIQNIARGVYEAWLCNKDDNIKFAFFEMKIELCSDIKDFCSCIPYEFKDGNSLFDKYQYLMGRKVRITDPEIKSYYEIRFGGDEPLATDGWYVEVENVSRDGCEYYEAWICNRYDNCVKFNFFGIGVNACPDIEYFFDSIAGKLEVPTLSNTNAINGYNNLIEKYTKWNSNK